VIPSHEFYVKKCILAVKKFNLISVYNILICIAAFLLKLVALVNLKIKLGVDGRSKTFKRLNNVINNSDSCIWFHCASLGEYEQGLPVFEAIKKIYPKHKIVLSFFSPSGYEVRKSSPIADAVVYLPLDTKKNAEQFLNLINPELVVFVKYEIWPNYLNEIRKRTIRAILISALFRSNQIYFKPYGKWMQKYLKAFDHFFVQNETSKQLLSSLGYDNVSVSGDTRYDRVSNQLNTDNTISFIDDFIDDKICFVAGSTWPEGEKYICNYINSNHTSDIKFLIAPHDIRPNRINDILKKLDVPYVLFSEKENKELNKVNVLIIDSIGILSKLYSYADFSYVGGAIGTTGLHNILEPAVFGIPIIIGKNHSKFPEAKLMIDNGGVFAINNEDEFKFLLNRFATNREFRKQSGELNASYIKKNKGAVVQIADYIRR
jgi:3-deoxy-D-manno-octulosonic-acid transferase